jgi:hypothetical protein
MSRRVWAVLLSLCLVAFLFEGAVHSVHHLDSDREATACWVASAAGSLSIVSSDSIMLDDLRPVVVGRAVDPASSAPASRPLGTSRERAPPAALSA